MTSTDNISMVYWHSEGGVSTSEGVHVRSANLIDFFISLRPRLSQLQISAPRIPLEGAQLLEGSEDVDFSAAPTIVGGMSNSFLGLLGLLRYMVIGEGRHLSKCSDTSVSVGLSGFGTIVGFRRVFVDRKAHAFVVRGDRLKTVSTSSRPFLSKKFALLRIRLYIWILTSAVKSGRAQVWFQGGAYMSKISDLLPLESRNKLFVLNAVLRDMPKSVEGVKRSDLVFLGRLTVEKGLLELVESLQILKMKGQIVTLKIIGDGPDRLKIEQAVQSAGLVEQIEFVGFVSDKDKICKLLTEGRVFVLPSYTEGLPRSMLEAASLGVPIVCTAVGGIPLVFKHKENALFVDVADGSDLAEKIEYALLDNNEIEINKLVTNAKSIASAHSFGERGAFFLDNLIT